LESPPHQRTEVRRDGEVSGARGEARWRPCLAEGGGRGLGPNASAVNATRAAAEEALMEALDLLRSQPANETPASALEEPSALARTLVWLLAGTANGAMIVGLAWWLT
jgi:hypothetical protein